ncbi:putative quinol monooxygenase [Klebsiella variicola]|uniref:putative quinol monooxygenase n=1 Tax=Klebsiella variicola TaxID=244366 RepID=UPI0015F2FF61
MSFELFTPEDGSPDLLSVERWTDKAGFEAHLAFPYVKTFIECPEKRRNPIGIIHERFIPSTGADHCIAQNDT